MIGALIPKVLLTNGLNDHGVHLIRAELQLVAGQTKNREKKFVTK